MPGLLNGDCITHWSERSEPLCLRGTVTGGRKEQRSPSAARFLRGQFGLGAGTARRAGRPRAAVVPGFKPALFFGAPGDRSSRGWAGVRVSVPGDRLRTQSRRAGCSGAACRPSRSISPCLIPASPKALLLSRRVVSGEADLSAERFQGLNCLLASFFSFSADNLCFEQIALEMSKLSISRIFFKGSFIDILLTYCNAHILISRLCCTSDFNI